MPIKQIIENLKSSFSKLVIEEYNHDNSLKDFRGQVKGIDQYLDTEIKSRRERSHAIGVFLGVHVPWKILKEVDNVYLHTDDNQKTLQDMLKDINTTLDDYYDKQSIFNPEEYINSLKGTGQNKSDTNFIIGSFFFH